MTTSFHIQAENATHIIEADCECDFVYDPVAPVKADREYPVRYRFYDVVVTDRKTGLSEAWGDEMPEDFDIISKEKAEEQFYEER